MTWHCNREDLQASNPLVAGDHASFLRCTWTVYSKYDSPTHWRDEAGHIWEFNGEEKYLQASENARVKLQYEPLVDIPYLFLEFARVVKDKGGGHVALKQWVESRGLLGLHENRDSGGPGELLEEMWEHACRARNLLDMYEAALSRDEERLRKGFASEAESWSTGPGFVPYLIDELPAAQRRDAQENSEWLQAELGSSDIYYVPFDVDVDDASMDLLAEVAGRIAIARVQQTLAPLVRPSFGTLAPPTEGAVRRWWDPELLTRSWVPVNLLGAMYLQFYWMMTSGGDLSRCKYCDQIISRASSSTGSGQTRKPRNDKVFCSSRCRQNYHYNNRIKPARKGNTSSNGAKT